MVYSGSSQHSLRESKPAENRAGPVCSSASHYWRCVMRNRWCCPYGALIMMQGDLVQVLSVVDSVQVVLQRQKVKVALHRRDNLEEQLTEKNLVEQERNRPLLSHPRRVRR